MRNRTARRLSSGNPGAASAGGAGSRPRGCAAARGPRSRRAGGFCGRRTRRPGVGASAAACASGHPLPAPAVVVAKAATDGAARRIVRQKCCFRWCSQSSTDQVVSKAVTQRQWSSHSNLKRDTYTLQPVGTQDGGAPGSSMT